MKPMRGTKRKGTILLWGGLIGVSAHLAGPAPSMAESRSVPEPSPPARTEENPQAAQVTRRLYLSPNKPPPDTVFQGILKKGDQQLYLYRHPTRMEQWRDRLAHAYSGTRTTVQTASNTRNLFFGTPPEGSYVSPLFGPQYWALLLILSLLIILLLGYLLELHHTPALPKQPALARTPPKRLHRFPYFSKRPRPTTLQPSAWLDPWAPSPTKKETLSTPLSPTLKRAPQNFDFYGSIEAVPLESILQILECENVTGALLVEDENKKEVGAFHFHNGKIYSIKAGSLRGVNAVCRLIAMKKGFFFLRNCANFQAAPGETWRASALLLDAHRMLDEKAGAHAGSATYRARS